MRLVVNLQQLADGGVRVLLRGGERLVAEEFLDGAEIGAVRQEMRGERVAQRVRVQIPIYVDETNIFFHDASNGALREAPAGVVQKDGLGVRRGATARGGLRKQFLAQRPVTLEGFLRLGTVRNDA